MKIIITPQCHSEIMYYVNKAPIEISGMGRVQKASDGTLVVTSVYLLKQENSAASTDIDPEAMAALLYETRNDPGSLNFWWHSHVNMGVFWSGTDMDTIKEFGRKGYLLATVFNKKNEHRTALFRAGDDFFPEIFMDNMATSFSYTPTEEQIKVWETNYTTLCTEKKWTTAGNLSSKWKPDADLAARRWDKDSQAWIWGDDIVDRDPYFWQSEGSGYSKPKQIEANGNTEKPNKKAYLDTIVGTFSGCTGREIIREIWGLRAARPKSLSEVDMTTTLVMYDFFEIMFGFSLEGDQNEEKEMQELFDGITESIESCQSMMDTFHEELPFYIEEINKDPAPKKEASEVAGGINV